MQEMKTGKFLHDFYPRPHMEGDYLEQKAGVTNVISTHALTWRATPPIHRPLSRHGHFYPRPHMEGDIRFLLQVTLQK